MPCLYGDDLCDDTSIKAVGYAFPDVRERTPDGFYSTSDSRERISDDFYALLFARQGMPCLYRNDLRGDTSVKTVKYTTSDVQEGIPDVFYAAPDVYEIKNIVAQVCTA